MRIHSFSRVLVLPLILLAGLVFYCSEYIDRDYSVWYFLPAMLAVVLYIFHGNIDFWYLKNNPAGLDKNILGWLKNNFVPYQILDFKDKALFEYRLELYLNARLFLAKGNEDRDVPEDIKTLIAGYGIFLGLQFSDILLGDYDRIFLYGHAFPSPKQNALHSVEVNDEDGVIILNSALVLLAFTQPNQYYNVAVHAYVNVIENLRGPLPERLQNELPNKIIKWTPEEICVQTGLENMDIAYMHVHHYVVFPAEYRSLYPEQTKILDNYFGRK